MSNGKHFTTNENDNKFYKEHSLFISIVCIIAIIGVIVLYCYLLGASCNQFVSSTNDESTPDQLMTIGVRLITDDDWKTMPTQKETTSTKKIPTVAASEINTEIPEELQEDIVIEFHADKKDAYDIDDENNENEIELEDIEYSQDYLLDINNPDYSYHPQSIPLSESDRELAASIVTREFGGGGYVACCLQAQALRDAMISGNCGLQKIVSDYQYDAYSLDYTPIQDAYDAVGYIFSGGSAVQHRILYMYSTDYTYSSWHESQQFVVEYQGVRFFDRW